MYFVFFNYSNLIITINVFFIYLLLFSEHIYIKNPFFFALIIIKIYFLFCYNLKISLIITYKNQKIYLNKDLNLYDLHYNKTKSKKLKVVIIWSIFTPSERERLTKRELLIEKVNFKRVFEMFLKVCVFSI